MSVTLTTHALDTSRGRPAAGMRVELWALEHRLGDAPSKERLLRDVRLNGDGRSDGPLAEGELAPGAYELRFHVGAYYGAEAPVFLDVVPVRFIIGDADGHYHVPLLVSPGGYSTYRGS